MDKEAWDTIRLVLEGAGVLIMSALGFIVKSLRDNDKELSDQISKLREDQNANQLILAEKYVAKVDFRDALTEVKVSIDGLRDLIISQLKNKGE